MRPKAVWRPDLDALQFHADNGNVCVVHRLAFRVLLGKKPEPAECLDYYRTHAGIFAAAAGRRLLDDHSIGSRRFHLNSRHIRRSVGHGPDS